MGQINPKESALHEYEYDQLAYQSDNMFTLELKPPAPKQAAATPGVYDEKREYSGERLTLNFQDLETRAVLQLIADFSGLNIVVSDTVMGSVTLRLQNVPWDQALDIVMTTKGLDMRRNGNVIIVAPAEEIAAREQKALEAVKSLETLEPLRSEFIPLPVSRLSSEAATGQTFSVDVPASTAPSAPVVRAVVARQDDRDGVGSARRGRGCGRRISHPAMGSESALI